MRVIMLYLITLLFFTYTTIPAKTAIEPEFEPYIRFIPMTISSIIKDSHLVVKFGDIKDREVLAFCAKDYDLFGNVNRRLVLVDKTHWDRLLPKSRQILILHELGHCLFNSKHDETLRADGCPQSMMYPTLVSTSCIDKYYAEYVLQLF
jgi:hypothetical protein